MAPVATPTPASGSVPGTRENPVALGSEFTVGEWRVLVSSVDPDAWPKIEAENQFNDPPAAGRQFVMFDASATYAGPGSGNPYLDLSWTIVGSAGNTFGTGTDDYCGVIPHPFSDQGETFSGGTVTGNVCVSVPADQLDGATIRVGPFLGDEDVFVATNEGQGSVVAPGPSIAPQTPDAGGAPGTRGNPLPIGIPFTVDDWGVTVDSVDLDAWPKIEAENQFNDPPAAGRQYVMFGATATYNGTGSGNPSFDMSWTIVGSAGNTFGTGTDDYCGVIPDPLSDQGETFPGGTVTGNVCISVASDQIDGATISVEQFLGEERVFVATQ